MLLMLPILDTAEIDQVHVDDSVEESGIGPEAALPKATADDDRKHIECR